MNSHVMNIDVARALSVSVNWVHARLDAAAAGFAERRRRERAARDLRNLDSRVLRDVGLMRVSAAITTRCHESA